MTLSQVKINMSPFSSSAEDQIVVDGHDITRSVRALTVRVQLGHANELTLTLVPFELTELGSQARLLLDSATADLLVRHGWTPPVERDRTVLLPASAPGSPEVDRG